MYKDIRDYAKTLSGCTKEKMIEEMKLYISILYGEQIPDYQMSKILSEVCGR